MSVVDPSVPPAPADAPAPAGRPSDTRASWAGPRATGVGLLAIGVVALIATFAVPAGGGDPWSVSGPRFFPLVASIGLIVCSLAFLVRVTVRPDADLGAHAAEEAAETDWSVPGLVAVALVAYVVLIEPLGWVLATALFFPFVARVLGSRAALRDVVAGAVLATGVYLMFTRMLAVPLPAGLLGF